MFVILARAESFEQTPSIINRNKGKKTVTLNLLMRRKAAAFNSGGCLQPSSLSLLCIILLELIHHGIFLIYPFQVQLII